MTRTEAHDAFQRADDAWQTELVRAFGGNAGDTRYTSHGRGAEGSALRQTYDARAKAHKDWLTANNCGPARVAA